VGAAVAHEENITQRDERDLGWERKKEEERKAVDKFSTSTKLQLSSEVFVSYWKL